MGVDNQNGKHALDTHLIAKVNAALTQKGYTTRYHNYAGNSVTPAMCNSITSSLSCGPLYIFVFYYIGHGGHPETAKDAGSNPWSEMDFGEIQELPLARHYASTATTCTQYEHIISDISQHKAAIQQQMQTMTIAKSVNIYYDVDPL